MKKRIICRWMWNDYIFSFFSPLNIDLWVIKRKKNRILSVRDTKFICLRYCFHHQNLAPPHWFPPLFLFLFLFQFIEYDKNSTHLNTKFLMAIQSIKLNIDFVLLSLGMLIIKNIIKLVSQIVCQTLFWWSWNIQKKKEKRKIISKRVEKVDFTITAKRIP